MSKATNTRLSDDGLRYTSRVSGSPFSSGANTRSCFKCGKHRPPSSLQSKKVLGRSEMVCKPSCAEAG
jgi:hypothetical protein